MNIINLQRMSKFLLKLETSKRQRRSVNYFRKYTIEDGEIELENKLKKEKEGREQTPSLELEALERVRIEQEKDMIIEGCKPDESQTDRRILFEMTGKRLITDEFPIEDETEEEFDVNVIVDQLLGYNDEHSADGEALGIDAQDEQLLP